MIGKVAGAIEDFLRLESANGIFLVVATATALLLANSPLAGIYEALLLIPLEIRVGGFQLAKPLLLWINDGLMAIFFFLVGLELKREVLEGELSNVSQIALPAFAAIGGMVLPAIIYVVTNWGDPVALKGWAIPAATDIAFALGILALAGRMVPPSLKILLLSIAIIDDIGAITIIAIFYTSDLSVTSLLVAAGVVVALFALNRKRVVQIPPYVLLGIVLWVAVLKSGVHATLAGVLLALFIPLRVENAAGKSPLRELEHSLHPTVAFGVIPIFAFANAGVALGSLSLESLLGPITMGITAGLFLGKQAGVFLMSALAIRLGLARLPVGVRWGQLYGLSILTGIGFTMSLFIGSLAFEQGGVYASHDRPGILLGTLLSALVGYLILRISSRRPSETQERPHVEVDVHGKCGVE